ncbi:MAG: GIY-YIG nuclease family protein [Saprospiraceae bacterium]
MAWFYVLYSPTLDKYYSGITSDSVAIRLEKHNSSSYGQKFTSAANDWEIKLQISTKDFDHARRMELYVKKRKSRIFIVELINSVLVQTRLIELTRK